MDVIAGPLMGLTEFVPPLLLGAAVLVVAVGWAIRESGPEMRAWLSFLRDRRR